MQHMMIILQGDFFKHPTCLDRNSGKIPFPLSYMEENNTVHSLMDDHCCLCYTAILMCGNDPVSETQSFWHSHTLDTHFPYLQVLRVPLYLAGICKHKGNWDRWPKLQRFHEADLHTFILIPLWIFHGFHGCALGSGEWDLRRTLSRLVRLLI